ncbi:hypothetical protein P3T23_005132 [Paraburkholderia sp. GAS448]
MAGHQNANQLVILSKKSQFPLCFWVAKNINTEVWSKPGALVPQSNRIFGT